MGQAQTQQVTTPITLDHNASENGNGPIFTAHFTPSESSPSKTWATATVESDNQEGCSSLASTSNQAQEDTFFRLPYSYQNSPSSGLPKNSNTIVATPPELVSTYSSTDDETPYTHAVPQEPQIPPDLDAMSGYNLQFITRDLDLSSPFDFVSKSHQHQLDQAERRSSYSTSTLLLPIYPLPSTPTDSNRRPLPILPAVQQLRDSASVRSSQRLSIQSARITSRFCLDDSFVRGLMSSESETSLSPPICVPQTVSGSSTLLNTGYEDPVTDSDNETVTVPGTCIQANFLSDSDGDSESPYPQSSQKVPHHTSLLSPVQVAFIPGPTVDVEGDDKDVAQSRSRLARIPKANKQGTGTLDSDTPELSHPSGGDYDGASPEAESTLLDTLRLSVTGSNAASIPDKNPVILSDEGCRGLERSTKSYTYKLQRTYISSPQGSVTRTSAAAYRQ
ncbi:hypothetical protein K435DRAFT_53032 [Dendrothele bispora CBS 962.96]|uniref:Uncharacterized protein n=1 Tax=Dendrothele bispora (strain CBS 962.96) TaxID=1314807 RepID=A0A4S8KRW0_DENBC|nr:hypothetical protein K435DRAFT_53032 [Dendrothele bispora CBS 962.96]